MAYEFTPNEQVGQAILRVAREQLDRAVAELSDEINRDPASAIHNARKAIKKERSLLRLSRSSISGAQRRLANAALRDAGRALSAARDADVMLASVDQLAERFAGQLPARTFKAIRKHVDQGRTGAQATASGSPRDAQAISELGAVRLRLDDWQLRRSGWRAIDDGLLRSYTRGRRALKRANATREAEDLHSWRKRVKDLWYHERLLAPTCGRTVQGHAKELDRLAELLGDDHDLAVLRQELTGDVGVPVDVDAVVQLIDHRRHELQTEAFGVGGRVYAEAPKAFRRRMRGSWKAGRELARATREQHPAELAAATREPRSG